MSMEINDILEQTVSETNDLLKKTFLLANALEIALEQVADKCETCLRREWCSQKFRGECFEWEWDGWATLMLRKDKEDEDDD